MFASTELGLYCSTEVLRDQSKRSFEHQCPVMGAVLFWELVDLKWGLIQKEESKDENLPANKSHIGEEVHTHESLKNSADHNSARPVGLVLLF